MPAPIVELFKHNLWANLRLLEACSALSEPQLAAGVPGTYGAIRDTLVHIAVGEERYLARLRGEQPVDAPFEFDFGELRERLRRSGAGLAAIAAEIEPDQVLRGTWRGEPYAIPAVVLLIQAINHATEHRAQVMTIMTQQGVKPPELDGWAYGEQVLGT